jgi:ATP-dependent Clp protease protease subunit
VSHNLFRNPLLAFRAANKHFGFRARVGQPSKTSPEVVGSLYLYDAIGADYFGEGITASRVMDALEPAKAAGVNRLNLYINSPGGDVTEATAIHSILDRYPGVKHAYVDGMAASAASFIALVGKTITTVPSGMWMIHNPWGLAIGDAATMRAMAEDLDKARQIYIEAYVRRTGLAASKVAELMDAARVLTADEAKEYGLTDFVQAASEQEDGTTMEPQTAEAQAAEARAEARVVRALEQIPNLPEQLRPPAWALTSSMETRLSARQQHPRTDAAGQLRTDAAKATQILPARH